MNLDMLFVVGPGHEAPGILTALYLERLLEKFYPQFSWDAQGLHNFISTFSTTAGFPSHINAETPGAIHEGGDSRYALAVSFGAVMDNSYSIVPCATDNIIGTDPGMPYLDPQESGAVLPILHVNGFEISERTVFGCMDHKELLALFTDWKQFGVNMAVEESSMKTAGKLIDKSFIQNPHDARLFSPDELKSNKLDAEIEKTGRDSQWDELSSANGGCVIEVPSEHMCQGLMQGYTLTGCMGIFPSYERFLGIIHTIMAGNQMSFPQRQPQLYRDRNLDPTGTQRLLSPKPILYRIGIETEARCSSRIPPTRRKYFLIQCAPLPEVREIYQSDGRLEKADLRARVINVTDLTMLDNAGVHPHSLSTEAFGHLFAADKCIHFNCHEYPPELQGLLLDALVWIVFRLLTAVQGAPDINDKIQIRHYELQAELGHGIVESRKIIIEKHEDPEGLYDLPRFT
ncbi:hypothetical protein N7454_000109 [Penicillium verhagenii]|nr:hypothetical protein N7454_000109 [Penicillium verhagenii]